MSPTRTWPKSCAALLSLVCGIAAGCNDATTTPADAAPSPDASHVAADMSEPPPDPHYPSPHPPTPLVDNLGGPIIANPHIVTVTFGADGDPAADPQRSFLESFNDTITSTAWWDAVRAGYCDQATPPHCIGKGMGGGHVHLTDSAAATYVDSDETGARTSSIKAMIRGYVANGTFPAPDANTIYAIYFPAGTQITEDGIVGGGSCTFFLGYHASLAITVPGSTADGGAPSDAGSGTTIEVPYLVLPRCSTRGSDLTEYTSHEIIEAATDPVARDPAGDGTTWVMKTDPVFSALRGDEVGDLCTWFDASITLGESGFVVQRSWSNDAAKAGHDPCVPAPDPATTPYFNTAPSSDNLTLAVGTSTTIDLTGFSDAPTSGDWKLNIIDVSSNTGGTAGVTSFGLSQPTAHNGSKLQLTVTLNKPTTPGHPDYLAIRSVKGTSVHLWPIAVTGK